MPKIWQSVGIGLLALAVVLLAVVALRPSPPVVTPEMVAEGKAANDQLQADRKAKAEADAKAVAATRVAFIGDSYTAGAGATEGNGWAYLVSKSQGWKMVNGARGGTGYVAEIESGGEGACGASACPNYLSVAKTIEAAPAVIVVAGGRNDGPTLTPAMAKNVAAVYATLAERFPKAQVVAISPIWGAEDPAPDVRAFSTEIEKAVEANGGTFLDIGAPFSGRPELITADDVHPNDDGHEVLADTITKAMAEAGVK